MSLLGGRGLPTERAGYVSNRMEKTCPKHEWFHAMGLELGQKETEIPLWPVLFHTTGGTLG